MYVGIMKPLAERVHYKVSQLDTYDVEDYDPLFIWDATYMKVDGRGMLVVANLANRFCGVTAVRGAHWPYFNHLVEELIGRSMIACGFSPDAVMSYQSFTVHCIPTQPHGQRFAGSMRAIGNLLQTLPCDHDTLFQEALTREVNSTPITSKVFRGTKSAIDRMANDLMDCGISDPFSPDDFPTGYFTFDTFEFPFIDPSLTIEIDNPRGRNSKDPERETNREPEPITHEERLRTCSVCGAEMQAIIDDTPFCLDCLRKRDQKHLADDLRIAVRGSDGSVEEYAVQHSWSEHDMASLWEAWILFYREDPRNDDPDARVSIGLYREFGESDADVLARLFEKVRYTQDHPSVRTLTRGCQDYRVLGLKRDHKLLVANMHGRGTIICCNADKPRIVIDNRAYTADEFFQLLSDYEGFELNWEIRAYTDPYDKKEVKEK